MLGLNLTRTEFGEIGKNGFCLAAALIRACPAATSLDICAERVDGVAQINASARRSECLNLGPPIDGLRAHSKGLFRWGGAGRGGQNLEKNEYNKTGPRPKGAECLSGILCFAHALVAQWIEHQLAELRVGGSSPLERAFSFKRPLLSCAVADNSNATFDTLAGYI